MACESKETKRSTLSDLSDCSTIAMAIFTLALIVLATVNYREFVNNVDLVARSVNQQSESIELQRKDFLLTHKPIVFVKNAYIPIQPEERKDPFRHSFVLTNVGKLPARDVKILVVMNQVVGTNIAIDNTQNIPILENATIYPSSDLMFWIPQVISLGGTPSKAEAIFTILYKCEGIEQIIQENMKFIFSEGTNHNWVYVGPNVDIFTVERQEVQKRIGR
jgi:hypothetical protein